MRKRQALIFYKPLNIILQNSYYRIAWYPASSNFLSQTVCIIHITVRSMYNKIVRTFYIIHPKANAHECVQQWWPTFYEQGPPKVAPGWGKGPPYQNPVILIMNELLPKYENTCFNFILIVKGPNWKIKPPV